MRANIVGLLAAALMGVCGGASANIVYNVNISDGVETLMGTITTDGQSGLLLASDFVSWSLSASGHVNFVANGPPIAIECDPLGCGVAALGGDLDFVGSSLQGLLLFDLTQTTGVVFSRGVISFDHPEAYFLSLAPSYTVGRASVPEPQTAILLGIGLACLGLACKRARRRQSAAV